MSALWFITVFAAYFVKGVTGFANTLIISSVMSFTANTVAITPVENLLSLPSSMTIAWRERKNIRLRECLPIIALVLLGSLPGIFLLKNTNAAALKIAFGFVIVALGAEMLLRARSTKKAKQSKLVLFIIGAVSGLLCGLYGIGALLAAYFGRTQETGSGFRGNLCFVFVADGVFRAIVYAIGGIFTREIVLQVLTLMPCMAAGLACGIVCGKKLNENLVRTCVIVMLILSGIALILTNL